MVCEGVFSRFTGERFYGHRSKFKSATHFELRIDGFPIGERVPIDDYVRGLPIIFSKPERMEVWFFDCEDADEPIAIARCHHSGALVFPVRRSF